MRGGEKVTNPEGIVNPEPNFLKVLRKELTRFIVTRRDVIRDSVIRQKRRELHYVTY